MRGLNFLPVATQRGTSRAATLGLANSALCLSPANWCSESATSSPPWQATSPPSFELLLFNDNLHAVLGVGACAAARFTFPVMALAAQVANVGDFQSLICTVGEGL